MKSGLHDWTLYRTCIRIAERKRVHSTHGACSLSHVGGGKEESIMQRSPYAACSVCTTFKILHKLCDTVHVPVTAKHLYTYIHNYKCGFTVIAAKSLRYFRFVLPRNP